MPRYMRLIVNNTLFFMLPWIGLAQQTAKKPLSIEAIFGGSLHVPEPAELRWAPDGRHVSYYLPGQTGRRALWLLNAVSGETKLLVNSEQIRRIAPSPEEATTEEREITRRIRFQVASYVWAPDSKRILFSSAGQLYLYNLSDQSIELIASSKTGVLDPKFSPNGRWISFVHNHDIWVISSEGGKEKQVTFGGSELLLHGDLDWIYQEEFDVRTGYYWSPDSRQIAFLELDESVVPVYPIIDEVSMQAAVDLQRYPKAGDPNPKARVGIVNIENSKTVWVNHAAEYIPRIDWADQDTIAVQLLNRGQNELKLIEVDSESGKIQAVLIERDQYWLNITNDLTFLSDGLRMLWTSERSGFRHIYLYNRDGQLVRQLTTGNWVASEIEGVDEQSGWVYYSSNQDETLGRHLYRVKLDGSASERLTQESGTHRIDMNSKATALVDSYSSLTQAPQSRVHDLASGKTTRLYQALSLEEYDLVTPEIKELKMRDGAIARILIYKPGEIVQGKKLPMLVYTYGMAGFPTIQDSWMGPRGLFHQFLAQQGIVVAQIDDRSSALPGHRYAVAAYHNLGPVAAKDHEIAVQHLKSLPFVDGSRMAIWGWSGGGFTTTFHMTHTRLFKVGIAVAPVTDWHLYDSIYTERYMGMPQENREAYTRTSPVKAAANYQGRLLLIHGSQDDNVHPQNTIQLINALIDNRKQFDLMLYPNKTHSIYGITESIHLYTMIYQYLVNNLVSLVEK